MTTLDAAATRAWVLGSLRYVGSLHGDLPSRVRRALRWLRDVVGRRGRALPFAVVYDTGHLLLEGDQFPFRSLVDLGSWAAEERDLRLAYENRFLNALLRDATVRRAIEAIARDPSRDDLVARTVELLLEPLLQDPPLAETPALNPVLLRELEPRGALDVEGEAQRWDEVSGRPNAHLAELRATLDRLVARLGERAPLGPEDLAEIEHWSAFRRAAQRLAGRRIAAKAFALEPYDPRRARLGEESTGDETELPDAGYYPEGGFSELANRGSLENLVPSELLYFGEPAFDAVPGAKERGADLFAIRHLEREALFYKRDSGQLQRIRRTVIIAVAPDQGLRLKLPWHSDPLAVCLYGLFVRLVQDLERVFARDALKVELLLVAEGAPAVERARDDMELLRVLLRHEIARGAASVAIAPPALDLRARGERARRVYGIAVQSGEGAPAGLPLKAAAVPAAPAPRIVVLKVGGAPPASRRPARGLLGRDAPVRPVVHLPTEKAIEEPLLAARDQLLAEITGAQA